MSLTPTAGTKSLYDPDLGSFLSVDPVFDPADPGSWNGYGYADDNPVDNADPSGQTCTTITAEAGMGDSGTVCGQTNSGSSPNESNSSGYDTGWTAGSSSSDAGSPVSAVQITPHVAVETKGVDVAALTRMFYDTYPDATWGSYHHLAADQQVTSIAMLWYNACKLHQDVCTPQLTKGFWELKRKGVPTSNGGLGTNDDIIIGTGVGGMIGVVGGARFQALPNSDESSLESDAETESESKPFAMGIEDYLDDFADAHGAETWKSLPEKNLQNTSAWKIGVLRKLSDPAQRVLFNLDGVDVWQGLQRHAAGGGGATDWELHVLRSGIYPNIEYWQGGARVGSPFQ